MTTITLAYTHARQVTCLAGHMHAVQSQKYRLPKPKARYPDIRTFTNVRTTTRERGNHLQGWSIYTVGGTRLADGES